MVKFERRDMAIETAQDAPSAVLMDEEFLYLSPPASDSLGPAGLAPRMVLRAHEGEFCLPMALAPTDNCSPTGPHGFLNQLSSAAAPDFETMTLEPVANSRLAAI
jgi:hypothetical protein